MCGTGRIPYVLPVWEKFAFTLDGGDPAPLSWITSSCVGPLRCPEFSAVFLSAPCHLEQDETIETPDLSSPRNSAAGIVYKSRDMSRARSGNSVTDSDVRNRADRSFPTYMGRGSRQARGFLLAWLDTVEVRIEAHIIDNTFCITVSY